MKRTERIVGTVLVVVVGTSLTATARADTETFGKHVVVSQEGNASDVGRDVLRAGGNAVDAAIATAFALAVTLPEAGNLGGGGYIVAYLADRKEVVTVDFREIAPQVSSARMYLDSDGKPRPRYRTGAWSAGVPGTVRGLGLAHARWGKRPWAELVRPAARLAREGFAISDDLAGTLNRQLGRSGQTKRAATSRNDFGRLGDYPESVSALGKPDGSAWNSGDRLIQADLAATLERIATAGPERVLQRPDRPAHRRLYGLSWRVRLPRRPEVLPGQGPCPDPHQLPGSRSLQHRPVLEWRRRALPDAQYPRAVRPQGRRPGFRADASPSRRVDETRVLYPGHPARRPRFRRGPRGGTDLKGLRRLPGSKPSANAPPAAPSLPLFPSWTPRRTIQHTSRRSTPTATPWR